MRTFLSALAQKEKVISSQAICLFLLFFKCSFPCYSLTVSLMEKKLKYYFEIFKKYQSVTLRFMIKRLVMAKKRRLSLTT